MSVVQHVDSDEQSMRRLGGIAALLIGIGYFVIIACYVPMGAPPDGAEARLAFVAGNPGLWWAILGLSVLTDFLFVPVALALYRVLKAIDKTTMLLAAACVGLFVILDLALTWSNYAVLIALGDGYAAAANDAQRAALVAAASYPSAVLESKLIYVYNTLTLSVGIFLSGLVMSKGSFRKGAGYLGLVTGALGMVSVAGSFFTSALDVTILLASALTTVWILWVGYELIRPGRR